MKWIAMPLWWCLIAISMGCQVVQPAVKPAEMQSESMPKVTLSPGDVIDIKFFYTPELNDTQAVRHDGKITLQLVGEVMAYGKTPDEFRDELIKLYTSELKRPEVAVIVRSLYERRVYVGGEVRTPGLILMPGHLTALEAIMLAGGFDPRTAKISNVVIIRHKDGKRYGCALDFTKVIAGGEEVRPFFLEPRDIVYVPRTTIVKVNQWIDQYINKIIPRTGMTLLYTRGAGTLGLDTSTAIAVP
jgi:protein involved in polysaccharide export with SLBB domain